MQNERLASAIQDFLNYLKEPSSFEQLTDDKSVIYHTSVKKLKSLCDANFEATVKSMEAIARNIQTLDYFKVGICSKILFECIDITKPHPFVSDFSIGLLIRTLILADRYLFKAMNYVENFQIMSDAPNEIKAWKSLDPITETAAIILSTQVSARKKFRENKNYYPLLQRLKNYVDKIEEIYQLYRLSDDIELILVHPQRLIGFRLILQGIQNNFHLFTLVQDELAQKGSSLLGISPTENRDAVQLAKGQKKFNIHGKFPDFSILSFYSWKGFYESEKNKTPIHPKYLLSGKNSPLSIPSVEGRKILILGDVSEKPLQWDTSEFKPLNQYLTSQVNLTNILDRNIVISILKKIQSLTT